MGKIVVVVGTRQSALALTQTNQVIEQLQKIADDQHLDYEFSVRKIVTKGDQILDVMLSKVGGKGLFVKEIEQALLNSSIDIAIHSMKDMPSEQPNGLTFGAIPLRADPRDCIISKHQLTLDNLPKGAKIGTSSLRRVCQLQHYRPDLQIESIRGNIDSRIKKMQTEDFDAIVLAAAGLHRMGWQDKICDYLSPDLCLPAVGQGALAVQCRVDDANVLPLLKSYADYKTTLTVTAERAFLGRLNGGCQIPIGAFATTSDPDLERGRSVITLTGLVGSVDGQEIIRETMDGSDPEALGIKVAEELIGRGADRILAEVRG